MLNPQTMSDTNISSTLSYTKTSVSGLKQESTQQSSGFSISEYLTKLAKGGDTFPQQNYQQGTGSHASHFNNDGLPSVSTSFSHPPPMPKPDAQLARSQLNPVPRDIESNEPNLWPRQQPPLTPHSAPNNNLHLNAPPIAAWSQEGDPPPATSWPAPRPDVWSTATTEHRDNNWQQQQSAALDPGTRSLQYLLTYHAYLHYYKNFRGEKVY